MVVKNKKKWFSMRMTDEELEWLRRESEARGKRRPDFVRNILFAYADFPIHRGENKDLTR